MAESVSMVRQIFTYGNFVDGVAGMSGGITAITVFYPLNKIRACQRRWLGGR